MSERAASSYAELEKCLRFGDQRSFFLPAGAGAGKTRALVYAIESAVRLNEDALFYTGSQVAAITYTRAAAEEILQRIKYDRRVWVSTIHAFAWEMIKSHPLAIRDVLIAQVSEKLEKDQQQKLRERSSTTPTSRARTRAITRNQQKLELLPDTKKFFYSPESNVPGRGELNHAEVISVFATLLSERPLLSSFLTSRFPVLLIDEAQDTTKSILPKLIDISLAHKNRFTLGLFGDTMQRVYLDGVQNLEADIPEQWNEIPSLKVNYRSDRRIVELANQIRVQAGSEYMQDAYSEDSGAVRLFVLPRSHAGYHTELLVNQFMAVTTGDSGWVENCNSSDEPQVKTLVLEHRFVADRLGFLEFFDAMNTDVTKQKMFGREDMLPPLVGYLDEVTKLVGHIRNGQLKKADRQLAKIRSSQVSDEFLAQSLASSEDTGTPFRRLRETAQEFRRLIEKAETLSLVGVLQAIRKTKVFLLTEEAEECLKYFESSSDASSEVLSGADSSEFLASPAVDESNEELEAWNRVLPLPIDQFESYLSYRKGTSGFDTQQGVKGLEFPRVLVILNDSEARGNLFKFDKVALDGQISPTDLKNQAAGKDTGLTRARRLLYVSCTRSQHGLAVVYYQDDTEVPLGSDFRGLFREEEIVSWEQLKSIDTRRDVEHDT